MEAPPCGPPLPGGCPPPDPMTDYGVCGITGITWFDGPFTQFDFTNANSSRWHAVLTVQDGATAPIVRWSCIRQSEFTNFYGFNFATQQPAEQFGLGVTQNPQPPPNTKAWAPLSGFGGSVFLDVGSGTQAVVEAHPSFSQLNDTMIQASIFDDSIGRAYAAAQVIDTGARDMKFETQFHLPPDGMNFGAWLTPSSTTWCYLTGVGGMRKTDDLVRLSPECCNTGIPSWKLVRSKTFIDVSAACIPLDQTP